MRVGKTLPIFLGLVTLALGFVLWATSTNTYNECHTVLFGIANALDPNSVARCKHIDLWHFGSIGVMGLGAILFLLGLFGPKPKQ